MAVCGIIIVILQTFQLLRLHYHYFCKARYASDDVYYTTIEDFYHKALTLYVPFITVS